MDFREAYNDTCSTVGTASRTGNLHQLKKLLEEGCPVDVRDNRGWLPIHEAAYHNRPLCLQEILHTSTYAEEEEAVNEGTFEKESALLLATKRANVQCVQLLISKGADANKATNENYSPIMEAVGSESLQCVKLLLEAGADVNTQTFVNEMTPLHYAAEAGLVEITSLLLEHGARLDLLDDNHISPVFAASLYGRTDSLRLLIHSAIEKGLGNLINEPANDKATPLYVAAQGGHKNCVKLLLENGADPNIIAENPRAVALHAAVEKCYDQCMEQLFPVTKAEVLKECGQNLLELCLSHFNLTVNCIRVLMKYGVDIFQQIELSQQMISHSCHNDHYPSVMEYPFQYKTISLLCFPLLIKCCRGPVEEKLQLELTDSLLGVGLSPNARNLDELPPVLAAVILDRPDLLRLLVQHGANIDITNPNCLGSVNVIISGGLIYPSRCLLELVLLGARVESCFGRYTLQLESSSDGVSFAQIDQWDIQQFLMCYPDSNHWLTCQKLEMLTCLCWNPQLHNSLCEVICNQARWNNLKELAGCSTLSHLCRLTIFKSLATNKHFNTETLKLLNLPSQLIDYLLHSFAGKTLVEVAQPQSPYPSLAD